MERTDAFWVEVFQDAEFQAQYGGVGGARYEQIIGEIERRLDGCALLR